MSKNNMILIAALGVAAAMILPKLAQAKAAQVPAASRSAPIQNRNVNSDMFTRLLGGAWKQFENAQNPDGSLAFLMKNRLGQTVTSDGVPVSTGDSVGDWMTTNTGLDGNFTDASYGDTTNNIVDNMFPLSESLTGTW